MTEPKRIRPGDLGWPKAPGWEREMSIITGQPLGPPEVWAEDEARRTLDARARLRGRLREVVRAAATAGQYERVLDDVMAVIEDEGWRPT